MTTFILFLCLKIIMNFRFRFPMDFSMVFAWFVLFTAVVCLLSPVGLGSAVVTRYRIDVFLFNKKYLKNARIVFMIKYYFNDTAPEINFEKQNKSFHFPWSNPSDPSLLDPILVSVWNRFWSDQALMKVEETPICLLETVLRFAAFLNLTRKNLIGIYFTWIEAHCSKKWKMWLLPKSIYNLHNCK